MEQLKGTENIKNIIRYDIKGDLLSNPQDVLQFIRGDFQNGSDDGAHFDAARPGKEADKLMQVIAEWLQTQGCQKLIYESKKLYYIPRAVHIWIRGIHVCHSAVCNFVGRKTDTGEKDFYFLHDYSN